MGEEKQECQDHSYEGGVLYLPQVLPPWLQSDLLTSTCLCNYLSFSPIFSSAAFSQKNSAYHRGKCHVMGCSCQCAWEIPISTFSQLVLIQARSCLELMPI